MRGLLLVAAALTLHACAQECGEDEHLCQGKCLFELGEVPAACGDGDECVACPADAPPHMAAVCNANPRMRNFACGFQCAGIFGDCNSDLRDGCETSLMSDPANCGGCGRVCAGVCSIVGCVETLVDGEVDPGGLVAFENHVYWASRISGQIVVRAAAVIGQPRTVAELDAHDGVAPTLALGDDGTLFVASGESQQPDGGGIVARVLSDGGLHLLASNQDEPDGLIQVDGRLYWTNRGGGQVMYAGTDGGPVALVSDRPHPRSVAVNGATSLWIEDAPDGGSTVFELDPTGPRPVSQDPMPANLTVDRYGYVLWSDDADSSIWDRGYFQDVVGVSNVVLYSERSRAWQVTSVSGQLGATWLDAAHHSLRAAPNFAVHDVSTDETNPGWLTVSSDNRYLFWADGQRIRRLTVSPMNPWGNFF